MGTCYSLCKTNENIESQLNNNEKNNKFLN